MTQYNFCFFQISYHSALTAILIFLISFGLGSCSSSPHKSEQAEYHLQLGTAHLNRGDYPDALRELQTAEQYDSKNIAVQNNLGLAFFMRGRSDLAEKHLRNTIRLSPNYSDAKNNLARILIESNKSNEAQELLKEIEKDLTYPSPAKTQVNWAFLHLKSGGYSACVQAAEAAVKMDRENCLAHTYWGRCELELQKFDFASKTLDRAVTFCKPQRTNEAAYFSAVAYYRNGERAKAQARFAAIANMPDEYGDKAKKMLEFLESKK